MRRFLSLAELTVKSQGSIHANVNPGDGDKPAETSSGSPARRWTG
jgi:hypothetical protein